MYGSVFTFLMAPFRNKLGTNVILLFLYYLRSIHLHFYKGCTNLLTIMDVSPGRCAAGSHVATVKLRVVLQLDCNFFIDCLVRFCV